MLIDKISNDDIDLIITTSGYITTIKKFNKLLFGYISDNNGNKILFEVRETNKILFDNFCLVKINDYVEILGKVKINKNNILIIKIEKLYIK
ncbi:MAG: hypothetical protein M0R17_03110 [Candidatus Omnitrophica bacterium]|jgi:lysyl-tRNA synthetase class II|nr:hypothetical protein [Candidatus Omnitrophota bacterium]